MALSSLNSKYARCARQYLSDLIVQLLLALTAPRISVISMENIEQAIEFDSGR
jgi:hypothetical protein